MDKLKAATTRFFQVFSLLVLIPSMTSGAEPGKSPYGPDDEVGALNAVTEEMTKAVLVNVSSGKVYDLAVEFFPGMPGPQMFDVGVPPYSKMFPMAQAGYDRYAKEKWQTEDSYMDEVVLVSLHAGTQIDAFSHVTNDGKSFNGINAEEHLGLHGWTRGGVEKIPPIVTRALLLDVAAMKGTDRLPDGYLIGPEDLQETLDQQGIEIQKGDAVLIRTGQMTVWPDAELFYGDAPVLTTDGARWLVENGAVLIGADNPSVGEDPNDPVTVHMYALGQAGVNLLEQLWLEDLARDKVYRFALIAAPLKFRGGTGSPIRPLAIPLN